MGTLARLELNRYQREVPRILRSREVSLPKFEGIIQKQMSNKINLNEKFFGSSEKKLKRSNYLWDQSLGSDEFPGDNPKISPQVVQPKPKTVLFA